MIYHIPKRIKICCTRQEDCCSECPMYLMDNMETNIPPMINHLISFINKDIQAQEKLIRKIIKIPKTCKSCLPKPLSFYSIRIE